MAKNTEEYDGSIQKLADEAPNRWGNPDVNLDSLIPFGLGPIDTALWGQNPLMGDLFLWIGEKKSRKSTMLYNVFINIYTGKKPKEKPVGVIDTLEPGVPPERVFDHLICNLASRYLMEIGHKPLACPICNAGRCDQLKLCPEYLYLHRRTPEQEAVIEAARITLRKWPLKIFGPNRRQGNTRSMENAVKRWVKLVEEENALIFACDHLQQYSFGPFTSDYEKQIQTVSLVGDFVAQYKRIFHLISQVSLTSIREARQGLGKITAAGGDKGAQEANAEFTVSYDQGKTWVKVALTVSRRSDVLPPVTVPIDKISGAMAGEPKVEGK